MRSRHHHLRGYGAVAALVLLGGSAGMIGASAASAAVVDPAPIAPHQQFIGQVNGVSAGAVIKVACFGPVTPGETGHPLSGQSVDVLPLTSPVTSDAGYTGESADHIVVGFGNAVSAAPAVLLRSYVVKAAIPTSLNLPCYGNGKVFFTPAPTSPTARPAAVPVTYANVGL